MSKYVNGACVATKIDGNKCQMRLINPENARCRYHQHAKFLETAIANPRDDDGFVKGRCAATKKDGNPCGMTLISPINGCCKFHQGMKFQTKAKPSQQGPILDFLEEIQDGDPQAKKMDPEPELLSSVNAGKVTPACDLLDQLNRLKAENERLKHENALLRCITININLGKEPK